MDAIGTSPASNQEMSGSAPPALKTISTSELYPTLFGIHKGTWVSGTPSPVVSAGIIPKSVASKLPKTEGII